MTKDYGIKVYNMFYSLVLYFPYWVVELTHFFPSTLSRWPNKMTSFLGIGVELAKSNKSLRTDQIFILYSMFLLENSRFCKELLIERYNKVGDLNLYVVNARFHLMFVFSTQVRVSPYIP
jgi:hypothetical protein